MILGDLDAKIRKAEKMIKFGEFQAGVRLISGVTEAIREFEKKELSTSIRKELCLRQDKCAEIVLEGTETVENGLQEPGKKKFMGTSAKFPIEDLLVKPDDGIFLNDIIGMKAAKLALIQAVLLSNAVKDMVPKENQWRDILLFGSSGVGKSKVVKAFINTLAVTTNIRVNFINLSLDKVCGSMHGDTEKNLTEIFNIAGSCSPSVILFDEIDSLCSDRDTLKHESDIKITNHFLTIMDGITSSKPVLLIGTTNKPHKLDFAFYRRFQKMIYVELPSTAERELILRTFMRKVQPDKASHSIDFEDLAIYTSRYSPADLLSLVTEAVQQARCSPLGADILNQMEKKQKVDFTKLCVNSVRVVTEVHLKNAKRSVQAAAEEEQVMKLNKFAERYCGRGPESEPALPDCNCCSFKEFTSNPWHSILHGLELCMRFASCE